MDSGLPRHLPRVDRRYPVIYTSTSWWSQGVGSGHGFGATVPLWVARSARG
ncbi:MAG: hypothetical protein WKF51_00115 [Geodermatophilaceae bacterium]